jgi:hypothetical protein
VNVVFHRFFQILNKRCFVEFHQRIKIIEFRISDYTYTCGVYLYFYFLYTLKL